MKERTTLDAKDPYELRLGLAATMSERDIRAALASGDMGFLHSYTTGSAVDGPGVRVVAWTSGCNWRCKYCHNPDTWTVINGTAVPLERAFRFQWRCGSSLHRRPPQVAWNVRLITSICCSRVSRMKLTA